MMNQAEMHKRQVVSKFKLNEEMKTNFFMAYSHFLKKLCEYSYCQIEDDNNFKLKGKEEEEVNKESVKEDLLAICDGDVLEEFEDKLLNEMMLNNIRLKLINLQHVLEGRRKEVDLIADLLPNEIKLIDMSFSIGDTLRTVNTQTDSSESDIISIKKGHLKNNSSFSVIVQMLLQVKSPLTLDMYHEDLDCHLISDLDSEPTEAMKAFLQSRSEVHFVLFEGLLRQNKNLISDYKSTQKAIKTMLRQLNASESIDVEQWKIKDIDLSLCNK